MVQVGPAQATTKMLRCLIVMTQTRSKVESQILIAQKTNWWIPKISFKNKTKASKDSPTLT